MQTYFKYHPNALHFDQFQHYRQANSGSRGIAPPPYPGRGGESNMQTTRGVGGQSGVPGHGYGEGRGHYNRSRGYDQPTNLQDPAATTAGNGSHGGRSRRTHQDNADRHNLNLSGGHRSSRIEMQPMR